MAYKVLPSQKKKKNLRITINRNIIAIKSKVK